MTYVDPTIFREYSIRGIFDQSLTIDTMNLIGKAFGTYMSEHGGTKVVIGRDVRVSSDVLRDALAAGLVSTGCNVIDVGKVPTPLLNFSTDFLEAAGGVMITASHNPPEYNGAKIRMERTLIGDDLLAIHSIIDRKRFKQGRGSLDRVDTLQPYVHAIKKRVTLSRQLKVIIDASNGTNGLIVSNLLEQLGCEVRCLNCEPDGSFPNHPPDPTKPENVTDLIRTVVAEEADLGLAYDGDGDRVVVVDEKGHLVLADRMLALFSRQILKDRPGAKIVFEALCSQALYDDIIAHGGEPIVSRVGYAFVHEKMLEEKASLGGEMAGHIFFGNDDEFRFDDGILASCKFLELASNEKNSISELIATLPQYYSTPEYRITCPEGRKFAIVDTVKRQFGEVFSINTTDGVKVLFGDGWGIIRASLTQPALSIRFEAKNISRLDDFKKVFREELRNFSELNVDF